MRAAALRPVLLLASSAGFGCGGGGGGSSGPPPTTVTLSAVAAIDGIVAPSLAFPSATGFYVGDDASDGGTRSCLAFDLSAVPAGATILSAELAVFQSGGGGAPLAGLGDVLVDHVALGVGLDPSDFSGNTLEFAIGDLSSDSTIEVKLLDVTEAVAGDVAANRARSDFRLWFPLPTDFDGVADFVLFDASETVGGTAPELRVTYRP